MGAPDLGDLRLQAVLSGGPRGRRVLRVASPHAGRGRSGCTAPFPSPLTSLWSLLVEVALTPGVGTLSPDGRGDGMTAAAMRSCGRSRKAVRGRRRPLFWPRGLHCPGVRLPRLPVLCGRHPSAPSLHAAIRVPKAHCVPAPCSPGALRRCLLGLPAGLGVAGAGSRLSRLCCT